MRCVPDRRFPLVGLLATLLVGQGYAVSNLQAQVGGRPPAVRTRPRADDLTPSVRKSTRPSRSAWSQMTRSIRFALGREERPLEERDGASKFRAAERVSRALPRFPQRIETSSDLPFRLEAARGFDAAAAAFRARGNGYRAYDASSRAAVEYRRLAIDHIALLEPLMLTSEPRSERSLSEERLLRRGGARALLAAGMALVEAAADAQAWTGGDRVSVEARRAIESSRRHFDDAISWVEQLPGDAEAEQVRADALEHRAMADYALASMETNTGTRIGHLRRSSEGFDAAARMGRRSAIRRWYDVAHEQLLTEQAHHARISPSRADVSDDE